jgi:hypothetical protein
MAAVGGAEQRPWPWGDAPLEPSRANLGEGDEATTFHAFVPVGSAPEGAGRWGQLDLAGSRRETTMDHMSDQGPASQATPLPLPCNDCLELRPDWKQAAVRDVAFLFEFDQTLDWVTLREAVPFDAYGTEDIGFRCARDTGASTP